MDKVQLRRMGVPAAAVVDLDILKGSSDLKDLLKSCYAPQTLVNTWGNQRGEIYSRFKEKDLDPNKCGIEVLDQMDQEVADVWSRNLKEYGIFVVPGGALESWLSGLGVSGHGANWLVNTLEKMKTDPDKDDYLRPEEGDVWDFIRDIASWIADPNRKGMPS